MKSLLEKLELKEQESLLVIDAPEPFVKILNESKVTYDDSADGMYEWILVFAYSYEEASMLAKALSCHYQEGGHMWFCYPKKSSKKYRSDLSRSNMIGLFQEEGLETVTQVAIDEDWSALRYRYPKNIKTMKRSFAVTEEGKRKVNKE